jgi:sugar/nucleoside kinase (ribokinase family)
VTAALIGVGSPLVDQLLAINDIFLVSEVAGAKGGMELVDAATIDRLVRASGLTPVQVAGGSTANTAVGVAALGVPAAFIGCCGADAAADFYRAALAERGCEPRLVVHASEPTGRVLALVTPDAQRTLRTCLGAAAAMDPAFFTPETFRGARVVALEGYACFNHALARAVARAATAAGCDLALDLASFEVVRGNRPLLDELLAEHVDIVFANEDEAAAWHPGGPAAALEDLAGRVDTAVVKLGKAGALLAQGSRRLTQTAEVVTAVDTTGAGDCYAAGFLAARLRGLDLAQCGQLGARCGTAVVQVLGAQMPAGTWQHLRGWLDAWR